MLTGFVFPMLLYLTMVSAYSTKVNYVKRKCGSTIMVSTAERLVLEYDDDTVEEDCQIKLEAYDPYNNYDNINLHIRFLELDLPCAQASVIIDKFDTTNEIYGSNRNFQHSGIGESVCGDEAPDKIYESNLKKMSINFHKRIPNIYDAYFDILVTKVNNGLCDENKEFECDSGRCVDESLVCDDYYNCDDESDEDEGCFWTVGAIIGVTIGFIIVIALAGIGAVLMCRKRKYGVYFRKKQAPPIAKIRPNDQPYFSESTSSLAKQLTPIPYAPSLNPSITPNLSPESQRRAMGSTFKQFNNGPQRDFGLSKVKKEDERYPRNGQKRNSRSEEHELKTVSAHVEESDSRRSSGSTYDSLDRRQNGDVESKRSSEPRRGSRERRQGPRKISDYRNGSSSRMSSSSNQSVNKSPSINTDV